MAILAADYDLVSYVLTLTLDTTDEDWLSNTVYELRIKKDVENECNQDQAVDVFSQFQTNEPPIANDISATTDEDTLVVINVIVNDIDNDGAIQPDTVSVVTPPDHGSTVVNLDGTVDYTPDSDFSGTDFFRYVVGDDSGELSNTATVNLTVLAANDPPAASDDIATTDEDVAVEVDVLANDTDIDGTLDATSVVVASIPANGITFVDFVTGKITYTPNLGYSGIDDFTYTVSDDAGDVSAPATVTITVTAMFPTPTLLGAASYRTLNRSSG